MRWRFGPSGVTNDPVTTLAAEELLRQTIIRLKIVELESGSVLECKVDAENTVSYSRSNGRG